VKRLAGLVALSVVMLASSFAPSFAQAGLGRVRTAQMPAGARPGNAATADVDGDGRPDLVVSARLYKNGERQRGLMIFRGGEGDALVTGEQLELTADVVAWAVGDVHADPGDEVVLFNASGAFVWRPGRSAEERFARLLEGAFLWQLARREEAFQWSAGVRDLDGDGWVDLILPEPSGYRVAFQRRDEKGASFAEASVLRVPPEPAADGTWLSTDPDGPGWRGSRSDSEVGLAFSLSSGLDDEFALPSTLLTVLESTPAPQLLDWDGDGDLDLLGQTPSRLHVWTQANGAFVDAERQAFELPVAADRDRKLDASYSSHAVDLNGDSKADCVIFAGDKRSNDIRTQSLVFVQGAGKGEAAQTADAPLFGPRGLPQDLLVFAGFVATVRFAAVDGDALPDMIVSAVRPDLIDQLRAVSSEAIDTDLFVYLNRNGRFARRPDLAWRMSLPLKDFHATARFVGDLSGDGVSELMVRDEPGRLRVLMVRAGRGGELSVIERPLWELALHESAEVNVERPSTRGKAELIVIERGQVMHVRFP
jgi:hypothetical protein